MPQGRGRPANPGWRAGLAPYPIIRSGGGLRSINFHRHPGSSMSEHRPLKAGMRVVSRPGFQIRPIRDCFIYEDKHMSKKRINKKKIKQVASRARRSCRTKSNTPEELRPDNVTTTGLQYPVTLPDRIELEFSTERPDVLKRNAVERAKKVDLKEEIKGIVQAFRTDIDERLK